jgi:predicted RNA binding protein YcfA (HicA-like mRNA interferase family)
MCHRRTLTIIRQSGSHIRLTTSSPSTHHVTIPAHAFLKIGTLASIIGDVSEHLKIDRDELLRRLF